MMPSAREKGVRIGRQREWTKSGLPRHSVNKKPVPITIIDQAGIMRPFLEC
jgi:hypothetical protein